MDFPLFKLKQTSNAIQVCTYSSTINSTIFDFR